MANQRWFGDSGSSGCEYAPQAPTRSPNRFRQDSCLYFSCCMYQGNHHMHYSTTSISWCRSSPEDYVENVRDRQAIVGFHLDESTDAKLLELRNYMSTLTSNTNKTIILFSSLQHIVSETGPAAVLISEIISKKLIRFIVVDEIHLV